MGRIIILNNVSDKNNNKEYWMEENPDGYSWTAKWGRIGGGALSTQVYPMSDWDKKYKEKLKKGYQDVTDLMSVEKEDTTDHTVQYSSDPMVQELVEFLQSSAKTSIKKNYTVKVADVTDKQLAAAQAILDDLATHVKGSGQSLMGFEVETINKRLLDLYKIIPRKMSDTRKFLLQGPDTEFFTGLLGNEQDLLDTLKTQVTTPIASDKLSQDLAAFSLTITTASPADRDRIRSMTDFSLGAQKVFVVQNARTQQAFNTSGFDKTNVKLLYHGSRNENFWSILNQGLLIRPTGAIHSGSMFGDGIYAANKAKKSIGYTSLRGSYWAGGSSSRAYLALFEFNLGTEWHLIGPGKRYESWMSRIDLARITKEKCNSVYARGGADLVNDEYIIYEPNRCTIKYLIELS